MNYLTTGISGMPARIYRVDNDMYTSGVPSAMACADPRITDKVRESYPEVENMTRVLNIPTLMINGDKQFFESNTYYVDSTFFDIFSYEFVKGDPKTALLTKEGVVITEKMPINFLVKLILWERH